MNPNSLLSKYVQDKLSLGEICPFDLLLITVLASLFFASFDKVTL
jgi:hypothetical protein